MNVRAPVGQYSRIFFLITKQFGDNNANMDYLVICIGSIHYSSSDTLVHESHIREKGISPTKQVLD